MKSFGSVVLALSAGLLIALPESAQAQFFNAPVSVEDDFEYRFAAAGDLNGDGKVDLVALRFLSIGDIAPKWFVRLNDGNGSFVTSTLLNVGGQVTPSIADADGDGFADILFPLQTGVRILWGGDGSFSNFLDLPGLNVSSVAVGNLNGDNYLDLAISHRGSAGLVTVRYGIAPRQFDVPVSITGIGPASDVAIANIDGDSAMDLYVLATPVSGDPVLRVVYGAGGLASPSGDLLPLAPNASVMTSADLDGDGLGEAIVPGPSSSLLIARVEGGALTSQPVFGGGSLARPNITDANGDGRLDIITAPVTTHANVLLAQDDGTFMGSNPFQVSTLTPRWRLFGDVNGDGTVDIVFGGGRFPSNKSEIAVALHVPPLRIGAAGVAEPLGTDGLARVIVDASVNSGHSDVSLSWFSSTSSEVLGTGARLILSLPVGVYNFTVRAATPEGLQAVATAVVTVTTPPPPPPPASETTVQGIQTTLDTKLDVAVSSRASQESLTQTQSALMALSALMQTQLDMPISSRASAADVAAIGNKVDHLQTLLPTTATLNAITQAVNSLGASLGSAQTRLAIEQALARGDRIASFYLPTAHGGQLELVRTIVIDVADKNEAAGGNALAIAKARRSIAEADARKAAGDYRTAYILYSVAYQILGA